MHNLPDYPETKVTSLVVQEVDLDRLARRLLQSGNLLKSGQPMDGSATDPGDQRRF